MVFPNKKCFVFPTHYQAMKKTALINSWSDILHSEFEKNYMVSLSEFLKKERARKKIIYPPERFIFNSLNSTDFKDVKVVILGQDPYHGAGQANGLSFSVCDTVKKPPSLINIYRELESDLGLPVPDGGNLIAWSLQGVLLLNSVLTVEHGKPGSHEEKGWEQFTDKILEEIVFKKKNIVFILWGKKAQKKIGIIENSSHLIIKSPHPSPFSANKGFFGSRPFSKTNKFLCSHNMGTVDWVSRDID